MHLYTMYILVICIGDLMKLLLISLSIIALFFIACDDEADKSFMNPTDDYDPSDVSPPTVTILIPADSSTVARDSIRVFAFASDDTGIRSVDFRINSVLVLEDRVAPYEYYWDTGTLSPFTNHEICATARDNGGHSTTTCISVKIGQ
jgi:hypothetical protein